MGKPTGFKEFPRKAVPYRPPVVRIQDFKEIYTDPEEELLRTQGARCMDCGVPFCKSAHGLPDRQPDPGMERPGLSGPLARGPGPAAQDQQLPGVHGARLPRAVRRRLRAGHHPAGGDDQEHRERHHRPRLRRRLGQAESAGDAHGQERGHRRFRARRTGRGRPTEQARARSHGLRAGGPHRRPAGLRHPQHETRQGRGRTADRTAARGGDPVRHEHAHRQERRVPAGHMTRIMEEDGEQIQYIDPQQLLRRFDARPPRDGRHSAARSAAARPRVEGHLLRDGLPDAQHQEPARFQPDRRSVHQRPR